MARQSLVVVAGPAPQSSQILSGSSSVTQAPVVAQTAAGAVVLPTDSNARQDAGVSIRC